MSALIYKKMSEVMKDIGAISKDQKNTAQGFSFRGIDQFVNALHPALNKQGVFMTPRVTSYTQEIRDVERSNGRKGVDKHVALLVEYDFFAEDGSKVTVGPVAAEGLDSGDKATNKALSAALKYALIQTFCVPTTDMVDGDKDSPELGKATPKTGTTFTTGAVSNPESIVSGTIVAGSTVISPLSSASSKKISFSKKAIQTVETGDDI